MKKAVYYGVGDVRVEDVPVPEPGPGQIKMDVKYCGICGSDLHEYRHGPFPLSPFGHEACGTISALGPGVQGYSPGERICTVYPGAFAETMVCPVERVIKIPDTMSWERAAVFEPLSGAAHAIARGRIQPEHTVFIAGSGTVGLMLLMGCKAMGIKHIFMTDVLENRRRMADTLGASEVWNPTKVKTSTKIKSLTNGRGVDVSIEAVGKETTLKECLASTCHQGTCIVQGVFTQRAQIHMLGFVHREMTMIGTSSINPPLAFEWLQTGKIQPERIISQIIPLTDIVEDGFELLVHHGGTAIKILTAP